MPKKLTKANMKADIARKYFDTIDVYTNKILSSIVEKSNDLSLNRESLKEISNILEQEKASVKNWGFDQISKSIK
jgi:hypothetical protein